MSFAEQADSEEKKRHQRAHSSGENRDPCLYVVKEKTYRKKEAGGKKMDTVS